MQKCILARSDTSLSLERKVERITRYHYDMMAQNIQPRLNWVGRYHCIFRYVKSHSLKHAVLGAASYDPNTPPFLCNKRPLFFSQVSGCPVYQSWGNQSKFWPGLCKWKDHVAALARKVCSCASLPPSFSFLLSQWLEF